MSKKKDKEVQTITSDEVGDLSTVLGSDVPAFMQDAPMGNEDLKFFTRPPVIKVIQPSARSEYSDHFDKGDVIANPIKELIVKKDTPFYVTPLYFFAEWTTMNPLELTDLPMIQERSRDPNSRIAIMSKKKETWYEEIEGRINPKTDRPYRRQHVENLNFICLIHGVEALREVPIVFSFNKGKWKDGSRFSSILQQRRAPIYGCNVQMTCTLRKNPNGDFYGFDIENPKDFPKFVENEAEFKRNQKLYESFVEVMGQIEVQYDDPNADEPTISDM